MAHLLIADDEPEVRKRLEETLAKAGHSITLAYDGVAALDGVRNSAPDLLLIDWMMPELTGGEVTKQIREQQTHTEVKDIPIIGMTDLGDEESLGVFLNCGANDVWKKDLSATGLRGLFTKIERLLSKSKA